MGTDGGVLADEGAVDQRFVLEECIAIGDDGDDKSWNASLVRLKPYKS